jgi:hypothetical protein
MHKCQNAEAMASKFCLKMFFIQQNPIEAITTTFIAFSVSGMSMPSYVCTHVHMYIHTIDILCIFTPRQQSDFFVNKFLKNSTYIHKKNVPSMYFQYVEPNYFWTTFIPMFQTCTYFSLQKTG